MNIMVFGKQGCASCQTTKNKFVHYIKKYDLNEKVGLDFYDMETIDGLSEGSYHDVLNIPTTIFKSKDDDVVARWDGEVPTRQEYEEYLK